MNNKDMIHIRILTHLPVIKDIKCPPAPRSSFSSSSSSSSSFISYLWPEFYLNIEIPKDIIDRKRNTPKAPFASLKEYSWDIS